MNSVSARFLLENVGAGVLAPALVTALVPWLATRFTTRPAVGGAIAALALPLGFLCGYGLFPWAPIHPDQPWHWLPAVAVAMGVAGAVGAPAGSRWAVRLSGLVAASALAAWCVVPEWADWKDDRLRTIAVLAVALTVLTVAIRPLAARVPGRSLPGLLAIVTVVGAVILGLSQNLKFAQLAGVIAASLGGWTLMAWRRGTASSADALPAWVGLVGGLMFLGWAYSFSAVPAASYALVPCAPLGLWLADLGVPRSRQGAGRAAVRGIGVALPLLVALGLALAADLAMVE